MQYRIMFHVEPPAPPKGFWPAIVADLCNGKLIGLSEADGTLLASILPKATGFLAMIDVTDASEALEKVKIQLERASLLERSELAWCDQRELIFRTYYPVPAVAPFDRHLAAYERAARLVGFNPEFFRF
jgi:hypothetical protein